MRAWGLFSILLLWPATAVAGMGNEAPVVDSITISPSPIPQLGAVTVTCSAHDTDGSIVQLRVVVSGGTLPGGTSSEYLPITAAPSVTASVTWTTPAAGPHTVQCGAQDSGGTFGGALTAWMTAPAEVVAPVGGPPAVESLTASATELIQGGTVHLTAVAADPDGDPLSYAWSASAGTVLGAGAEADFTAPAALGPVTVSVAVTDAGGTTVTGSVTLQVVWALAATPVAGGGEFAPERVAVDSAGTIYATSPREGAIVAVSPLGERLHAIPVAGRLGGVAVGAGGTLYVGDLDQGKVTILDATGIAIGVLGAGVGELAGPVDIAVDPVTGRVYVADGPAGAVKVYEAGGAPVATIPIADAFPTGVTLSPDGSVVYVADQQGGKVHLLTAAGAPLGTIGAFGDEPGELSRTGGLALAPDGSLYVVDVFQSRLSVYAPDGGFVATVGGWDPAGTPGSLQLPLDAAVDPFGRLIVTNVSGGRLEVFGLTGASAPACAGDADCDGLPDLWEVAHGLDAADPGDAWSDADGDGLANLAEHGRGTDPTRVDTDGDGASDQLEVAEGTDPLDADDRWLIAVAADQELGPTRVVLDGSGSSYRGGVPPIFAWDQLDGPELVTLAGAGGAAATFVARTAGSYRFRLRIEDGAGKSAETIAQVTLLDLPPVADAGSDAGTVPGDEVVLDGRFSADANGQPLAYAWLQVEGPPVVLEDADTATPRLTPTATGVYAFTLVATDDTGHASAPDRVYVLVDKPQDHVPVAAAPSDLGGRVGDLVALDGSASVDADGALLGYGWRQVDGPPVALEAADAPVALFTPLAPGRYAFELVVDDGDHVSVPARVVVAVHDAAHPAPVADAGLDQRVLSRDDVTLDGAGSFGADGIVPVGTWRQVEGPPVVLGQGLAARFVPLETGVYVFELEVADGGGPGGRDRVTVVVDDPAENVVPVALAAVGTPGPLAPGQHVLLDGRASWDGDGAGALGFRWTQIGGPRAILTEPRGAKAKAATVAPGWYTFELRVDDGVDRSPPARVDWLVEEPTP